MRANQTYLLDLESRGWIKGLTHLDRESRPLCHFFGGVPYAQQPQKRFQRAEPLPDDYSYGTQSEPGEFTGHCPLCPQQGDDSEWSEDCLNCNVWVPLGEPPEGGWPVLFWIHGGFLQFGSPNGEDVRALLSETACKALIVMPAYRLNAFGFLASPELTKDSSLDFDVNLGFWDQRLALEWTAQNARYFGGNASNITIGGYSAGSHSTFYQLAYDLYLPDNQSLAKRALMFSNGPGMQPKSMKEAQWQFQELLHTLSIPLTVSPTEKISRLRSLNPHDLLSALDKLKYHQFRAVTDDYFVPASLFEDIDNGNFAQRMLHRQTRLIMGECKDEHFVYGTHHTPANNPGSVLQRLQADYPLAACQALMRYYFPGNQLPAKYNDWQDAFGRVYADCQIHHMERGLADGMAQHGAAHLLYRYRMEWRAQCVDEWLPREWGVTHGSDMVIWFWGNGHTLTAEEKKLCRDAFVYPLARYLQGDEIRGLWDTKQDPMRLRVLKPEGQVRIEGDAWLEEGLRVWGVLKEVGATGGERGEGAGVRRQRRGSRL